MQANNFQKRVLDWFDVHGRKTLPWQQAISAYRVWVSEIMLQQTQVSTVIDYFNRFMQHFPDVTSLSQAGEDQVLALWSGLGYYARARNLHKCALMVCQTYDGEFPNTVDELQNLPGIGRSTAGAITAIAFQKRAAILDGNVKRVLSRFAGIKTWYGQAKTLEQLWEIAEKYTPTKRIADYTQAMMDLGAMVCTRSKPSCSQCPLQSHCYAHKHALTASIPAKKPKKVLPVKQTIMLILENAQGEIFLYKRPSTGIWGGLWSLPEALPNEDLQAYCQQHWQLSIKNPSEWATFRHTFSHYHLDITAIHAKARPSLKVMADDQQIWYKLDQPQAHIGLAAPVKKLLKQVEDAL